MAIAFVQGTGNGTSASTTLAKAYTSTLTSGSYLLAHIIGAKVGAPPTATIADSAGNVWTLIQQLNIANSISYIFGAPNTHGAVADTVTATFSAVPTNVGSLLIMEYTGVFNASAIDAAGAFVDTTGTSYIGTSVTTTRANDVVVGLGYDGAAAGTTITAGANQTLRVVGNGNGGSVFSGIALDQPAVTPGAYTPSLTTTASTEFILATVALASVAAPTSTAAWLNRQRRLVNKR